MSERLKEIEKRLCDVDVLHRPYSEWLIARVKKLTEALDNIIIHNSNAINGIHRGFIDHADNDIRQSQLVARKALEGE